jgi:AraC family transcriptional regulator
VATVERVAVELAPGLTAPITLPSYLNHVDPLIATTMLALEQAFQEGVPDLYAETAAQFLAAHLLIHHTPARETRRGRWSAYPLSRVDRFLRDQLAEPITLAQLAEIAGMSPFQLLRAAKATWGETPLRRLTRLRMEKAQHLLDLHHLAIIEIAFACGYTNPSHFATAFRRQTGVTPSQYRHR